MPVSNLDQIRFDTGIKKDTSSRMKLKRIQAAIQISRLDMKKIQAAEWWLDRLLALYLHPIELYPQSGRLLGRISTGNSPLLLCTYALVKEGEDIT